MKTIIEMTCNDMRLKLEDGIVEAVQECGINVDKERLTKALSDAKAFYDEGYADGRRDAMRWIPVAERLPELKLEQKQAGYARNWYIVSLQNGVVKELAYEFVDSTIFGYGWHETAYTVTHWMEKPAPPKEGE